MVRLSANRSHAAEAIRRFKMLLALIRE